MKKGAHQSALKYLLKIKTWALTSMEAIQPGLNSDSERERATEMDLSCAFCRRFRRSRDERWCGCARNLEGGHVWGHKSSDRNLVLGQDQEAYFHNGPVATATASNPKPLIPAQYSAVGGGVRAAAKDGEGRRRGTHLGDGGGPGAEPPGGAVALPADPAGVELAGAAAGARGAAGEEGGVPRHLPLRRRGEVDPQHPGPHGRRAPHPRHPQTRPPPLARNEESHELQA
jgi:hypothetical protein